MSDTADSTVQSETEQRIAEIREWAEHHPFRGTHGQRDIEFLLQQLSTVPEQIAAAVQAEREACAELAEGMMSYRPLEFEYCTNAAVKVAAAIRARGEAK